MLPFLITLVWGGAAGFINPARDWVAPPPGPYGNWTWSDASSPAALTRINSGARHKKAVHENANS